MVDYPWRTPNHSNQTPKGFFPSGRALSIENSTRNSLHIRSYPAFTDDNHLTQEFKTSASLESLSKGHISLEDFKIEDPLGDLLP